MHQRTATARPLHRPCSSAAHALQYCCTCFAALLHRPCSCTAKRVQYSCKENATTVQSYTSVHKQVTSHINRQVPIGHQSPKRFGIEGKKPGKETKRGEKRPPPRRERNRRGTGTAPPPPTGHRSASGRAQACPPTDTGLPLAEHRSAPDGTQARRGGPQRALHTVFRIVSG